MTILNTRLAVSLDSSHQQEVEERLNAVLQILGMSPTSLEGNGDAVSMTIVSNLAVIEARVIALTTGNDLAARAIDGEEGCELAGTSDRPNTSRISQ